MASDVAAGSSIDIDDDYASSFKVTVQSTFEQIGLAFQRGLTVAKALLGCFASLGSLETQFNQGFKSEMTFN